MLEETQSEEEEDQIEKLVRGSDASVDQDINVSSED